MKAKATVHAAQSYLLQEMEAPTKAWLLSCFQQYLEMGYHASFPAIWEGSSCLSFSFDLCHAT